jgi:hypothetical protein
MLSGWKGTARIYAFDDQITKDILEKHLGAAGMFSGFGRWAPRVGGDNGRFAFKIVKVEDAA